jgi:hypothetical protein
MVVWGVESFPGAGFFDRDAAVETSRMSRLKFEMMFGYCILALIELRVEVTMDNEPTRSHNITL